MKKLAKKTIKMLLFRQQSGIAVKMIKKNSNPMLYKLNQKAPKRKNRNKAKVWIDLKKKNKNFQKMEDLSFLNFPNRDLVSLDS